LHFLKYIFEASSIFIIESHVFRKFKHQVSSSDESEKEESPKMVVKLYGPASNKKKEAPEDTPSPKIKKEQPDTDFENVKENKDSKSAEKKKQNSSIPKPKTEKESPKSVPSNYLAILKVNAKSEIDND